MTVDGTEPYYNIFGRVVQSKEIYSHKLHIPGLP